MIDLPNKSQKIDKNYELYFLVFFCPFLVIFLIFNTFAMKGNKFNGKEIWISIFNQESTLYLLCASAHLVNTARNFK